MPSCKRTKHESPPTANGPKAWATCANGNAVAQEEIELGGFDGGKDGAAETIEEPQEVDEADRPTPEVEARLRTLEQRMRRMEATLDAILQKLDK